MQRHSAISPCRAPAASRAPPPRPPTRRATARLRRAPALAPGALPPLRAYRGGFRAADGFCDRATLQARADHLPARRPGSSLPAVLEGQVRIGVCSESGKEITLGIVGRAVRGDRGDRRGRPDRGRHGDRRLPPARPRPARLPAVPRALPGRRGPAAATALRPHAQGDERVRERRPARRADALARLLLQLAEEHGEPAGSRQRIALKLSQQELGNLVAATRRATSISGSGRPKG